MKSLFLMAMAFVACHSISAQSDSMVPNYLLPKVKTKSDGLQTISPVSILDFKVQRLSRSRVLISWHTELEQFSNGFSVQRRLEDEGEFKDVALIKSKSKGDSTLVLDYTFTDSNGFGGPSYYRLKQKDGEGTIFYTTIKVLKDW